ncbi:vWA domain-containing protein [Pseudooceanicola atlanticus]|uniref:vWA domain-containing protein n=1 Tax=Pseudooceanicola atlanticus TaxID=1461694 RepID=UPI0023537BB8|nr:vWA domain-containing protein [Pseudooceanicola atlanticus]
MTLPHIPQNTQPLGVSGGTATGTTMPGDPLDPTMANLPVLKVTQRKKMPNGVAQNVKQHFICCTDHSTSMTGDKLQELLMGLSGLFLQLADPSNKDGFRITVIPFNNSSHVHCFAVAANAVPPLNLMAGGGTNFDSPLKKAIAEIQALKAAPNPGGWHWLKPIVLFLSDGQANVSDKNIEELHEIADVVAIAYGDDADVDTLARISSKGVVEIVGTDSGALRDFLAVVGNTMVSTLKAG